MLSRVREFRIRISLATVRQSVLNRDFTQGLKLVERLISRYPYDIRVLIQLGDLELFSKNLTVSQTTYEKAKSLLKNVNSSNSISNDEVKFLGAYISYRLFEIDFLQHRHNKIVSEKVIDEMNSLPAGTSTKALFFLEVSPDGVPRLLSSRRRAMHR